ncbi:MAG TPA: hypothetical protein VKZ18_21050, partial [Polyangia bacterium]|nr:hypothetical protein [Polyangia bacterium]
GGAAGTTGTGGAGGKGGGGGSGGGQSAAAVNLALLNATPASGVTAVATTARNPPTVQYPTCQ